MQVPIEARKKHNICPLKNRQQIIKALPKAAAKRRSRRTNRRRVGMSNGLAISS